MLSIADHDPHAAAGVATAMLDHVARPTAFFCGDKRSTVGGVEELWRRGAQASVVGFDDFDLSAFLPRAVSLVNHDTRVLGTRAAQRLFARIGGFEGPTETELLATKLVERGLNR